MIHPPCPLPLPTASAHCRPRQPVQTAPCRHKSRVAQAGLHNRAVVGALSLDRVEWPCPTASRADTGRAPFRGLAGIEKMLADLQTEFLNVMQLMGCTSIEQIKSEGKHMVNNNNNRKTRRSPMSPATVVLRCLGYAGTHGEVVGVF